MFGQRAEDPHPATHYRSERISAINGQYFFYTREGTLEGPYVTRVDTQREINLYIQRQAGVSEPRER